MSIPGFNNGIFENIMMNNGYGIAIQESFNSSIYVNILKANNLSGIYFYNSFNNIIYHNDIMNNNQQVYVINSTNVWDNGYPFGGNYWMDHNPPDEDKDKIGDKPYVIDEDNIDRHPLIYPFEFYQPGYKPKTDVNMDGIVNIIDVTIVAKAFQTKPGDSRWNPIVDIDINEIINIIDLSIIAKDYGKTA